MNDNRPPALQHPDDYDTAIDFSLGLEVGRETFSGHAGQGELIKALYETENLRYLVIFDTDLEGTCNENAVRRVEYDYLVDHPTVRAKEEVGLLLDSMRGWFEELGIEPFSVVAAPWERRDLSRFDQEDQEFDKPELLKELS